MKVLLYTEGLKMVGKSGLGKAIEHQKKALSLAGVDYTLDPNSDYDILHINTYFPKSYFLAKKAKKKGKKVTRISLCSIGLPKEDFNLLIIPVNIDQKLKLF